MAAMTVQLRPLLRPEIPRGAALPSPGSILRLLFPVVAFGVLYGGVMGAFGGLTTDRWLQIAYSAVKVPLLLLVTFAICLPSFFVLNTLLGVREDFGRVLRAIISMQVLFAIVLAALAPYTAVWYLSTDAYNTATIFNGAMFLVASLAAHVGLRRLYVPLIESNLRHRTLLRVWLVLYIFVAIQMAWVLRPFVGNPHRPTTFLRSENFGNAYEVIGRLIWNALNGRL